MNKSLHNPKPCGVVTPPSSKSQAHRLLICAALSGRDSTLVCRTMSDDILATINCLNAMGADIRTEGEKIYITPIKPVKNPVTCDCGESGSTLRFLLPVAAALGLDCTFVMHGRLPSRPMDALEAVLTANGVKITRFEDKLHVSGKLLAGEYTIRGDISSQFISGLEFALPIVGGGSRINITGTLESAPYVAMTEDALRISGVNIIVDGNARSADTASAYALEGVHEIEADWSAAAFWVVAGAVSSADGISIRGVNMESIQGDKKVVDIIKEMGGIVRTVGTECTVRSSRLHGVEIDAAQIPDLIPVLSIAAAVAEGETRVINGIRLRSKESDRISSIFNMLKALGADAEELEDGLIIHGKPELKGGMVDSCSDHRIAMSAAVAAAVCSGQVDIIGAEAVKKSYPDFWNDFERLT